MANDSTVQFSTDEGHFTPCHRTAQQTNVSAWHRTSRQVNGKASQRTARHAKINTSIRTGHGKACKGQCVAAHDIPGKCQDSTEQHSQRSVQVTVRSDHLKRRTGRDSAAKGQSTAEQTKRKAERSNSTQVKCSTQQSTSWLITKHHMSHQVKSRPGHIRAAQTNGTSQHSKSSKEQVKAMQAESNAMPDSTASSTAPEPGRRPKR